MKSDRQADQAWVNDVREANLEASIRAARGVKPQPVPVRAPVGMRVAKALAWLALGFALAAVASALIQ